MLLWVNMYQTADEWIDLAFLRANFTVVRDGAVQSSGVDKFTLVREASGWKIAVVAYTSITAPR